MGIEQSEKMRILVIGNGGREDALSWRLARSPSCAAIFAAPGNAGTASRGENWNVAATDGKTLVEKCQYERVDFAVIGPETAIAAGVGDRLREAGIAVFGPNRSSGRLESSKAFAKRFMQRHGVPTARGVIVHTLEGAMKALDEWKGGGVVVKADGLAAGKGVVVTGDTDAARAVLAEWYARNGVPGGGYDVLLEEVLEGREVSVFALADGRAMVPMSAACDYKRAGDGDTGPNTGGMGAYSPPNGFPDDLYDRVRERILAPVLRGLQAEGEEYVGVLYCGWTTCVASSRAPWRSASRAATRNAARESAEPSTAQMIDPVISPPSSACRVERSVPPDRVPGHRVATPSSGTPHGWISPRRIA